MIRLDTINRSLQLFLGAAKTTNNLQIVVSYSDQTASTYLGATQLSNSNGTTPVTICNAPAASTIRDIDMITVLNTDTVYQVVTIQYLDTATTYKILDIQLNVGDKLTWTHGSAWQVVDNSGNVKYTVLTTGGVNSFNGRTGAVTLTSSDVDTALGFTPAPQTSGSSLLYGNGSGGFSNVSIGSGISFSGGTLSATGSGGTVTSVALSLPSIFSVSGSPVTGSGTLTATLNSETANTFFAAPNGSAGTPTFRALVAADVPTLNQNTTGTAASVTGATQSAITSIPNLATIGTITTGIWNGTPIANSYLANSSITINGNAVSLGGSTTVTAATPNSLTFGTGFSSGSFNGSSAQTINLANSGVTAGTYGSASVIPVLTVNAQGQITSISTQATNAPSYQGTWNASTNTPTLTSSVGTQGYYYIVSVAGTTNLDGNALWSVGDWAIFGNGKWERIAGSTSESFTSLTTTNLAVTGLTGYMYANGSGNVTASTTIPTSALSGTISNAQLANSTISGVSLGGNLYNLTAGTNITFSSGSTYNGSAAITINAASTMVYPGAGIPNSTGTSWGTSYSTTGSGSVVALANSPTLVTPILGTPQSGNFSTGTFTWPTFNQNTTGNAATATSLAGGSQYSLPYQSAIGTTSFLSAGTSGSLLMTLGSVAAPIWVATSSLTVNGATNVAGGAANEIVYNTGSGATSFITAPSTANTYLEWNGSAFVWASAGTGTVTSVALSLPSIFTVSGSPITSSGTLTGSLATQSANLVFAGPSSGSAAAPTFRSLVAADIPALSYAPTTGSTSITTLGTITTGTWNGSVLGAAYGGTGEAGTLTGILYGNGTSAHTVATTAQLLSLLGTLPIANGGTAVTSTPSNGQLLIGNGTGYSLSTLSIGSGLSIVNGAGSITLANTQNTGPAFRASAGSSQTFSVNTFTKIAFNTKVFDTNSNYDATTNYRFTPTVGGYYQVTMSFQVQTTASTTACIPCIYKNGSIYEYGNSVPCSAFSYGIAQVTCLVYLNGSTDYIEGYGQPTGAAGTNTIVGLYFQAAMIRGT